MFRTRRSSHSDEPASILRLVESLDKSQCVKQLVCQIHAKEAAARSQEENLIIALVGKQVDFNNDYMMMMIIMMIMTSSPGSPPASSPWLSSRWPPRSGRARGPGRRVRHWGIFCNEACDWSISWPSGRIDQISLLKHCHCKIFTPGVRRPTPPAPTQPGRSSSCSRACETLEI